MLVAGMKAGQSYLNIHSSFAAGGEIRGQLTRAGARDPRTPRPRTGGPGRPPSPPRLILPQSPTRQQARAGCRVVVPPSDRPITCPSVSGTADLSIRRLANELRLQALCVLGHPAGLRRRGSGRRPAGVEIVPVQDRVEAEEEVALRLPAPVTGGWRTSPRAPCRSAHRSRRRGRRAPRRRPAGRTAAGRSRRSGTTAARAARCRVGAAAPPPRPPARPPACGVLARPPHRRPARRHARARPPRLARRTAPAGHRASSGAAAPRWAACCRMPGRFAPPRPPPKPPPPPPTRITGAWLK